MKVEIDKYTLEAIREAYSKEWHKKHKGEFCEGQVPQISDSKLINRAIRYYVGTFMEF